MGRPFCGALGLRVSGNKLNNVYYSICIFHIMFFFLTQIVVHLCALFNIWWFHLTPNRILNSYPVSASSDKCLQPRSSISNSKLSLFVFIHFLLFSLFPLEKRTSRAAIPHQPTTAEIPNKHLSFLRKKRRWKK